MNTIKIATILTVFNRKQKTLTCLRHLFDATDSYNQGTYRKDRITVTIFLTDDGCTDGTAEAVMKMFTGKDIYIMKGTGNLFWAGGMRLAWQAAIDSGVQWDYFLLLNDDTNVYQNVFDEVFEADDYGFKQKGKHGLASGITCQPGKPDETTYGGFLFTGRSKGTHTLALPTGKPQKVDMTHANILLIHQSTVQVLGIFYKGFSHSGADEDYSMMADRHGFPVFVTSHVCGECECDHDNNRNEIEKLKKMTLAERKQYVNSPIHCDRDYLLLVRRNLPWRFPIAWLLRNMRVYCPHLYSLISLFRGVYVQ